MIPYKTSDKRQYRKSNEHLSLYGSSQLILIFAMLFITTMNQGISHYFMKVSALPTY